MRYFRSTRYQKVWRRLVSEEAVFILFDTETTGLEDDAFVIQLAARKFKLTKDGKMEEIDSLNIYIKPPLISLPAKITELTGITDEILQDKPAEEEIFPTIKEFFGNHIIVAYNSQFDALKLKYMYERNSDTFKPELILDAMDMARDFAKRLTDFKLGTVAKELGLDGDISFHDASGDVEATARIMQVCLNNYMDNPMVNGYSQLTVNNIVFYKAKSHTENRININTDKGLVYYNTMYRYFASPGDVDLRYIDIDDLESQVCEIAEVSPRFLYKYNESEKPRFAPIRK